jgi:hypothetical protein
MYFVYYFKCTKLERHKHILIPFYSIGGECTIPEQFHGDWWVYQGPKAFSMNGNQLSLYENDGEDTRKFRCEFQTDDVVLLKYQEMVRKDGCVFH